MSKVSPRFVGKLDYAPQDSTRPRVWELEQDFGFLRDDNILVITLIGSRLDGASIPKIGIIWLIIGHPFERGNRFWSSPHDGGYKGLSVIIDLNKANATPETAMAVWREMGKSDAFIHSSDLSRKWWDKTMLQAMRAMKEKKWKQRIVYNAVRAFGWRSYRKRRSLGLK